MADEIFGRATMRSKFVPPAPREPKPAANAEQVSYAHLTPDARFRMDLEASRAMRIDTSANRGIAQEREMAARLLGKPA